MAEKPTYEELEQRVRELEKEAAKHCRVEKEVRENGEKWKAITASAKDAVIMMDHEGKISYWNEAAEQAFGYSAHEAMGKELHTFLAPQEYQDAYRRGIISFWETGHGPVVGKTLELEAIRKDATKFPIELSVSAVKIGEKWHATGIVRDITKRKQAEEEKKELEAKLLQTQKLEAIATLAGGVAHDFNNLLMAIQCNASLMLFDIDPAHPFYELLINIKNEVKSGAELTRQLLGYAMQGRYYVQTINVNELVEKTSGSIGRTMKKILIHHELAEDLFAIKADQGQIQQALMNLLVNAADAMPNGGDLTLKTANVTDQDMEGKLRDPKPGNYVQLSLTDTGSGMDKETQERIFDPFFTTKGVGRGTGLGLAAAYGIVKGHGGHIDVESKPGHGTTFTIYLPATEKTVEETVKPAEKTLNGAETILVVDDEERVLDAGGRMLKKLGYTVLEARSGREAIEIYKDDKDKIDLVILDMVMPCMDGGEVYDRMKEINPNVKVLLASGYTIDSEAKEILARGCDAFMQKPFGMQELSIRIREILEKK
jgi:two-component system cell cycle sensor histidine kinase/response regulator CckA